MVGVTSVSHRRPGLTTGDPAGPSCCTDQVWSRSDRGSRRGVYRSIAFPNNPSPPCETDARTSPRLPPPLPLHILFGAWVFVASLNAFVGYTNGTAVSASTAGSSDTKGMIGLLTVPAAPSVVLLTPGDMIGMVASAIAVVQLETIRPLWMRKGDLLIIATATESTTT